VTGASGPLTRLNQVGVSISGGAQLRFDEDRFRQAYSEDPEAVEQLFAQADVGLGSRFDTRLDQLTNSVDGVLARKDNTLQQQQDLYDDRIAAMQALLDGKEQRLLTQFYAMESALAALQSQASALSNLTLIGLASYTS